MRVQVIADIPLSRVKPEHRVFLRGLADSKSVRLPANLRRAFVTYAKLNRRAFPWRAKDVSPYELLLAELLLIQTKAPDVAIVWPELLKRYPDPQQLAGAPVTVLAKFLRPLGLHKQRAKALRSLARYLVRAHNGQLPSSFSGLLSLPHVGLYTATAVTTFGYGQRVPIVDGNVLRIFGRVFGQTMGKDIRRSPEVWATAWALLPSRNFVQHNYGILDFAAQVCRPQNPRCDACNIRAFCTWGRNSSCT